MLTEPASYAGQVLDLVAWPEQAASWLRQANRFASDSPDLWVMAGAAFGWAQMTRRLLWSTPWQPQRTLVLGEHLAQAATALVGNACATNPLPIVVPCHRVLRADGGLGGYIGGLTAKTELLKLEAAA